MNARYLFPADYMADPAAHVWNGRIWIYPSHDRESGIPERDNGDHFDMVDYHALSIEPDAEGRLDPMTGAVVDHGEWVSGRRATGFVFAGIVFALKAGLGLGGAVCGWILGAAGFDPSAASQTPGAQQAILLSVSLIPAALFAVGCVALLFYPISKRTEREMQLELNARRSK